MYYEDDESESNVISLDSYRAWRLYVAWKEKPKTREEKIQEALAKHKYQRGS